MTYNLRIIDIPSTERPRERLLALGVKNLATAELLAILLATGQGKGKLSAVGLGQHILQQLSLHQRDPLDVLREVSPQELMAIPGVGPAKASTILAGVELGKRTFQVRPMEKLTVENPNIAAAALSQDLMWQSQGTLCHFVIGCQKSITGHQSYYHRHCHRNPGSSPRNFSRSGQTRRDQNHHCS